MDIWVEKVKTGEVWLLDNDSSKEVYKDGDRTIYKGGLKSVYQYKFYPIDPRTKEQDSEGYQFNLFDFM